jgi:hypothetical protein
MIGVFRYGPPDLLSMTTRYAIHQSIILNMTAQPDVSKNATSATRAAR